MGHSERTTLSATADTSGSKNSIQAIGSTVTYLQRYTLLAAVGLAAGGDDDGQAASPGMANEDFAYHREQIEGASKMPELQKAFAAGFKAAKLTGDAVATKSIVDVYEAKKRELA
jgi:hypothetical protein